MRKVITAGAAALAIAGAGLLATEAGARPAPNVTVCHRGSPLTVNGNALAAHLRHGDTEGACDDTPPPPPPPGGSSTTTTTLDTRPT